MAFKISDECIGCSACASSCPVSCISQKDNGQFEINPDECIDCGTCAAGCPVSCISQE